MSSKPDSPQTFTNIYSTSQTCSLDELSGAACLFSRIVVGQKLVMSKSAAKPQIRDLETRADLESVLQLEKEVWGLDDADVLPALDGAVEHPADGDASQELAVIQIHHLNL